MLRNLMIRNRDSRRSAFLNFLLMVKDLVNSDYRFGFLAKNCVYSHLDMSRISNFGPKIRNSWTLAQKKCYFLSYVSTGVLVVFVVVAVLVLLLVLVLLT